MVADQKVNICMPLIWDQSYLVGNVEIDNQHQELFHLANMILVAEDKYVMRVCFLDLFKYVREHFHHEEVLMKKINYPDYKKHIAGHFVLSNGLNKASILIGNDALNKDDLKRFISSWAYGHIPVMDVKLATYIKEYKELS